jgi:hypothetical protein
MLAGAVVLLLVSRQVYIVPFTGLGLSPAQLLFLGCVVLWAISWVTGIRGTPGLFALRVALSLVLLTDAVSYGVAMGRARLPVDQISAADLGVRNELLYVGVILFVLEIVRDWSSIELIAKCAVAGGALSGFAAVVQSLTGIDLGAKLKLPGLRVLADIGTSGVREGLVRPQGMAAHPLELAALMTVLIPVALGLVGTMLRRREPCASWIVATGLLVGGAAVSLSRLAVIGSVVAVLIVLVRWPVRRTAWLVVGAFAVVVFQMVTDSRVLSALVTLITSGSKDNSLASRNDGRAWVFSHLESLFLVGTGPGTSPPDEPVLDNEYLLRLTHTGVFGLAALVLLGISAAALALHAARIVDRAHGELVVGLAGALVAMLLCYAVLDVEAFAQISLLAAVLTGLGARAAVLARTERALR